MELDQLIKHALNGNVVLFVGAGFSCSATNVIGLPLKTGSQLSTHLGNKCGLSEPTRLEYVADLYIAKHGVTHLIELLNEEFQVSEIAAEHFVYGRIPWKRVYTTNYDNTIELAYRTNNETIVPITLADNIRRVSEPTSQCVHINGFIDSLTEETLLSTFKLTDSSYSTSAFSDSPWSSQFHHDISAASAVLFAGYSAYDLDIKRILLASSELREKTIFIVGKNPNEITRYNIGKFGHIVQDDTAGVAEKIKTIEAHYEPQVYSQVKGRYAVKIQPPAAAATPRDQDVHDLFLWGEVNREMVWSAVSGSASDIYVCTRDAVIESLQLLEDGEINIVVRSNLGNGKSIFLEVLGATAAQYGYEVFLLRTSGPGVAVEIEDVVRCKKKTLLLVDGYTNKRSEIEIIARTRTDQLRVVFAARTLRHDISYEWLYNCLGVDELFELDLDKLTDNEAQWFALSMDRYGLWQSDAKRSDKTKMKILKSDCDGKLSAILLYILKSPTIAKRLDELVNSLSQNREFLETTASILVLSVLEIGTTLTILSNLSDTAVMNQATFRNSEAIRELIDFDRGSIRAKNAVVARHILTTQFDPEITVSALAAMAEKAEALRGEHHYWQILLDLMRFTNVQSVLPSLHKMNAVLVYYERIKNLNSCKRNPHFWLQYAIAEFSLKKYREARIKLETARSHADARPNYDTFMIDNTGARLNLEEAVATPKTDRTTAINTFREARNILNEQVAKKENHHYPFRAAANYASFLNVHRAILNDEDKAEIARAARFMLRRIDALTTYRASHREVVKCKESMEEILKSHPIAPPK